LKRLNFFHIIESTKGEKRLLRLKQSRFSRLKGLPSSLILQHYSQAKVIPEGKIIYGRFVGASISERYLCSAARLEKVVVAVSAITAISF
jgi:hypothetical protein